MELGLSLGKLQEQEEPVNKVIARGLSFSMNTKPEENKDGKEDGDNESERWSELDGGGRGIIVSQDQHQNPLQLTLLLLPLHSHSHSHHGSGSGSGSGSGGSWDNGGGGSALEDVNKLQVGRKKVRLSKQQYGILEERFKEHKTVDPKQKAALAKHLNLSPRQVEVWFQNRRARTKLKLTQLNCDYLRNCCQALTRENTRLRSQLHQLRAALKPPSSSYESPSQFQSKTYCFCPQSESLFIMH